MALRWLVQQGSPFVTATGRAEFIREDLDVLNFELTPAEMATLSNIEHVEGLASYCYLRE